MEDPSGTTIVKDMTYIEVSVLLLVYIKFEDGGTLASNVSSFFTSEDKSYLKVPTCAAQRVSLRILIQCVSHLKTRAPSRFQHAQHKVYSYEFRSNVFHT
jgi:hypothetical protein